MNTDMLNAGIRRFIKGFLAGGVAQVVLIIGAGFQFHNLADLQTWGIALVVGFVTGGLLAIEKMLNFVP